MNGLKAYELMLKGETVVLNGKHYNIIGDIVYITHNDNVYPCLAFSINHDGFELLVEGEPSKLTTNKRFVGRVCKGGRFYVITRRGGVFPLIDKYDRHCNEFYKTGNYFLDRKVAMQVAKQETAYRLALRNGEVELNTSITEEIKELEKASWVQEIKSVFAR